MSDDEYALTDVGNGSELARKEGISAIVSRSMIFYLGRAEKSCVGVVLTVRRGPHAAKCTTSYMHPWMA